MTDLEPYNAARAHYARMRALNGPEATLAAHEALIRAVPDELPELIDMWGAQRAAIEARIHVPFLVRFVSWLGFKRGVTTK